MLVLLRGNNHSIYELQLKNSHLQNYYIHQNEYHYIRCAPENFDNSPEILENFNKYGPIYREYKLRFTFLPNPTSLKTRGKTERKNNDTRHCYSAYNLYSKDIRESVEDEYIQNKLANPNETGDEENDIKYTKNGDLIINKDVINKLVGDKWKNEDYDTVHWYEMFCFIDRMRFFKETNRIPENAQLIVEEEKDYLKKEELISKICYFKQIFKDHQKKGDTDPNGPFVLYYHQRLQELQHNNPDMRVEEFGPTIYEEFTEEIMTKEKKFNKLKEKCNFKDIDRKCLDLINDEVLEYLPSKKKHIENIEQYSEFCDYRKEDENDNNNKSNEVISKEMEEEEEEIIDDSDYNNFDEGKVVNKEVEEEVKEEEEEEKEEKEEEEKEESDDDDEYIPSDEEEQQSQLNENEERIKRKCDEIDDNRFSSPIKRIKSVINEKNTLSPLVNTSEFIDDEVQSDEYRHTPINRNYVESDDTSNVMNYNSFLSSFTSNNGNDITAFTDYVEQPFQDNVYGRYMFRDDRNLYASDIMCEMSDL